MSDPEELEVLLAPLRATFHAKRRARAAFAERIVRTLDAYIHATDIAVAREMSATHGLAMPTVSAEPRHLAEELLRLIHQLPELKQLRRQEFADEDGTEGSEPSTPSVARPSTPRAKPLSGDLSARPGTTHHGLQTESNEPLQDDPWQFLGRISKSSPIVIIGGPPHLERLKTLPAELLAHSEWIDTTRQGTHAIGNLERRIRDHRISAIIILEGLVQHRHSDPLISAARSADVPHAFGGKGGRSALHQALREIASRLAASSK